jgi:hypothetical protein
MSKIVKVSQSDYRLKVKDSGTITLDTGVDVGLVVITGDLLVKGNTTTIDTANLQVEDNIILLNKGEAGNGVTEGSSGLEIDRGSADNVQFLWDEVLDRWVLKYADSNDLLGLKIDSISSEPTSNIKFDMQAGGATLRIINSTGYESRVTNPDDIPNRKFVTDYVLASGGLALTDKIFSPLLSGQGNEDTLVQASETNIRFSVRSGGTLNQRAQITAQGLDVDNINLFNNTVRNTNSEADLILTAESNNVRVDAVLNLDDQTVDPAPTGGVSRIYSKSTAEAGRTGLFFTNNTTATDEVTYDELVSKKRALLFSILF